MRVFAILMIGCICCAFIPMAQAVDKGGATTSPTLRPADNALAEFDSSMQKGSDDLRSALDAAAKQYSADLQTALDKAMSTANLNESNRDKAEIERVASGAAIDEIPQPAGTALAAARKKYDASVRVATATQSHDLQSAKRRCVTQLDEALVAALKAKDLDEANRIKSEEDRIKKVEAPKTVTRRTVDLLGLIDPKRDAVVGKWSKDTDGISCNAAEAARLRLPYRPPVEYDFEVEFTRSSGNESVNLILTRGDVSFFWSMGAFSDKFVGFSNVNGMGVDKNPSTIEMPGLIKNGQRIKCLVQVRNDRIAAFVDGKLIDELKTDYSNLELGSQWSLGTPALGIGAYSNPTIFHVIKVTEITEMDAQPASGTYLCDMVPFSVSTFTDGAWGFGNKGRVGVGDQKISVLGILSSHGLGTHPPSSGASVIKYQLDGKFKRITGGVALDDAVERGQTAVIFRLVGDGRDIWRAQPIQVSRHPQTFDVDVSRVKELQLVVDCPGDHGACQAVWTEPFLSK